MRFEPVAPRYQFGATINLAIKPHFKSYSQSREREIKSYFHFEFTSVFGQHTGRTFKWLSVKLNFTSVLNQKCLADNYTTWSPNDEVTTENYRP